MTVPKKFTPKRTQSAAEFRKAALKRLRERWEKENDGEDWEPEREPIVTPMFKAVDGGVGHVIEALRSHDDDDARAFLEIYDGAGQTDRKHLPLEAIAFSAGIGSLRLAEVAQTAIFLYDGMKTKMLLASGLPAIVQRSIQMAKTPKGLHDREMMLKAGGVLPVPKGAQIHIQNLNQQEREEETPSAPAWRTAEERLRDIHDAVEPKRLPSPESKPITIGGRLDHMQEETIHILRGD
jgi:hypothetical protein